MKKILSWILILIISVTFIVGSSILLINPGIKDMKEILKTKELTNEEIVNENKKIIEKYFNLSKEIDEKYLSKENELEKEYKEKEKSIESKYTLKMNDNDWYEEQKKKMDEKSQLNREKSTKSMNLFVQKQKEKTALEELKDNEIEALDNQNSERKSIIVKEAMQITFGILIIIIYVIWIITKLNKVIKSKNKVKESWSQIDVLLKRRYDLIPNIVLAVKECTNHESKTLKEVTRLRTTALKEKDKAKEIELNATISKDINHLILLSESYPELKSNENYLSLQLELIRTEDDIAHARETYNKSVLKYQNIIKMIPTNIFANILGYKDELFFNIEKYEVTTPKII